MQSLISGALFFFLVPGREDFLVSYGWFKMSQIPHRYLRHPFGKETVVRQWHLIDADGIPVGRLACQIAKLLLGTSKLFSATAIQCGAFFCVLSFFFCLNDLMARII